MCYNATSCVVFVSIFLLSSCEVFNTDADINKGITIKTSMSSGVAAMDVLQNERGIFVLGIAQKPEQTGSDYYSFYLTQVDQKGQVLWEKTYGNLKGRNRPQKMIATSDNHLLLGPVNTICMSLRRRPCSVQTRRRERAVAGLTAVTSNAVWRNRAPTRRVAAQMASCYVLRRSGSPLPTTTHALPDSMLPGNAAYGNSVNRP